MSELEEKLLEAAEYVCDNLCKFPSKFSEQEALDKVCEECKLNKMICECRKE